MQFCPLTGRTPGNMTDISILPQELFQDKDEIYSEEDDVLQLQCIAEVENINGFPSKVYISHINTHFT